MTEKLTTTLLQRATAAAWRHQQFQSLLTDAFRARYGVTHSDIDADALIDPLDYGHGHAPTLTECDRIMANAGYLPKIGRAALNQDGGA